jgi:hypothetical protein
MIHIVIDRAPLSLGRLECDVIGCHRLSITTMVGPAANLVDAAPQLRLEAIAEGWWSITSGSDVCPVCRANAALQSTVLLVHPFGAFT